MVELITLLAKVYRSDTLSRALGRIINNNTSSSSSSSSSATTKAALASHFQYLHDQFVEIAVNNIHDKYIMSDSSIIHSQAMRRNNHYHHHHRYHHHSNPTSQIDHNGHNDDSISGYGSSNNSYCSAQYHQLLLAVFHYQSHPYTIGCRTIINSDGSDIISIGSMVYDALAKKNIEVWLKYVENLMYYRHILASSSSATSSSSSFSASASTSDDVSTDAVSIDAAERVRAVVIHRISNHDDKRLLLRYQSQALEWLLLIIQTYFINSHHLSEASAEATTTTYNDVLMKTNKLLRRIERDYLWSVALSAMLLECLVVHVIVYSMLHRSIHPPIYPFIHPCIQLVIYTSLMIFMLSSIYIFHGRSEAYDLQSLHSSHPSIRHGRDCMKPLQWVDRAGATIQALETSVIIREQLVQCIDAMEQAMSSSPLKDASPLNEQLHQYPSYSIDEINRFVYGSMEMKNDSSSSYDAGAHHPGIADYDPGVAYMDGGFDGIQAFNAYNCYTALDAAYSRDDEVEPSSSYEIASLLLDGVVRSKTSLPQRQSRQLGSTDHHPTSHAYPLQHSLDKSNLSSLHRQQHRNNHGLQEGHDALNTVADYIAVVDDVILSYRTKATSYEDEHGMSGEDKIGSSGKCYSDTMTHDLIKLHRLQLLHQESVLKPSTSSSTSSSSSSSKNPNTVITTQQRPSTIPTDIIAPTMNYNATTTTPTTATATTHELLSSFISTNLSNVINTMHDDHHYIQVSGSSDLLTIHAYSDVHPVNNHITMIHTRVYNSSGFKIPSFQLHLLVSCNLLNADRSNTSNCRSDDRRTYGLNNNHVINNTDDESEEEDDGYDDHDDTYSYHISSGSRRRYRKILFDQSVIFDAQSINIATGMFISSYI